MPRRRRPRWIAMGNELTGSSTKRLKPSESAYVRVRLAPSHAFDTRRDDRLPARGVVILRVREKDNEAAAPTVKVRDLIVPQIQPSLAEHDVTRAGLAAAIVVLLVGMVASRRARPNPAIGGTPKWTPQSWSTNLAIGGALTTACTSRSADCQPRVTTPRRRRIRHSPAFFAALVALAPAVYGLLRVGSCRRPRRCGCSLFRPQSRSGPQWGQLRDGFTRLAGARHRARAL